ncbi:MAG TPA: ABC transporter permease [Candidatus Sulfotelmatobacter sp.]|nr:ABC transporter permease [Candidatus Sulfotelmatobacter sp.]
MKPRWGWFVMPCLVVTGTLLFASQAVFLRISFYRDRSFGRVASDLTLDNYRRVLGDPFYLHSLALTAEVALLVLACSLVVGYPAAYILARMRGPWVGVLLGAMIASALVAEVIKVLGLVVIFSADGVLNRGLRALGLIDAPLSLLGTVPGVVVGLLHFTLGFVILLLFGVIQTIPRSLEEAARVHGATRLRALWRVVLPLSLPGVIAGGLVVFNLSMGAFTAAALLGGGRVLTMPVLIERTMMLETRYAIAACAAAVLMGSVLIANVATSLVLGRRRLGAVA